MSHCAATATLQLLARPYLAEVLGVLLDADGAPVRFGALREKIPTTPNTLAARLRDIVEEGLATRVAYDEKPPRVEYRATDKARALRPLLEDLYSVAGSASALPSRSTSRTEPAGGDARSGRPTRLMGLPSRSP